MAVADTGSKDSAGGSAGASFQKQSTPKNGVLGSLYMMAFNVLCSLAWGNVFYVIVKHCLDHNLPGAFHVSLWPELESPLFFAQSLAVMEIVHSLMGLVRSSVMTTIMQVFSRLQLVWLLFPTVPSSRHPVALLTCVAAWSCAELLRFPFFAVQQLLQLVDLMRKDATPLEVPVLLKWLRYSGFTVLYPIGITSEVVCMWSSLEALRSSYALSHYPTPMPNKLNFELSLYWSYLILLCLYIPGSVQLYSHMLKQRRKYLYGTGQETTAKKEN
ncbi:protein tyrosine phosphatase-like domian-containing protein, putative [Eimeria necatrix]|uniref:very-long-chain (3R)-3-hydroxyacyl-CoA dehydratase n=1 Tax=Eimeria necatrix TaxID=51315 RepID=U6N098_9EIME|nr:protein tyrosine phosphatase-like domian-containing protein, putative [Eimeria necatrix]CDJ67375.1 protein tyrosine phosphatase-like domian-containing protein, putative [Eimeria necatrix]